MAVRTNKRAVFCFSAHTEPSKYLKLKYLEGGVLFPLERQAFFRLGKGRDRFSAVLF